MKNAIKSTAIAAALAAGAIASTASQAGADVASAVSEQRPVGAFSAIELSGPYHVVVHAQGTPQLELTGERKQLQEIETFVRGDTLVVRPVSRMGFHFGFQVRREVTINITAATLASLKASGSGDVELDQLGGDRFALASSGPGDVRASGAVRALDVTSSGSGDLDLHAVAAANVNLKMTGPGDVRLAGVGNELAASVSGSGDLVADGLHVARVTAKLNGPGGIRLSGSGRELRAEASGSGDLAACGMTFETASTVQRGPGDACIGGALRQLDAEVHGSGNLVATMGGKRLALALTGPGDARISGKVEDVRAEVSGSGSLEGRNLQARHADLQVHGPGTAEVRLGPNGEKLLTVDRRGSHHIE